ncbi:MAG TPA: hypothetical protein VE866_01895 [Candidatus Binatia bacterium]|nr:hypothetical protein [Candidatus Binatia bacterium]
MAQSGFEEGVSTALATLAAIPVLPDDRKTLLVTIASAVLHIGTESASRLVDAAVARLAEPVFDAEDFLYEEEPSGIHLLERAA